MSEYIERNAAIAELIDERDNDCNMYYFHGQKIERNEKYEFTIERLKEFPSADVQVVNHADWVRSVRKVFAEDGSYSLAVDTFCSACNHKIPEGAESPFCPMCGARMDKALNKEN